MNQPSRYQGLPVSQGVAAGQLYRRDTQAATPWDTGRPW